MKKLICVCLLMLVVTGLYISAGATGTEKATLASSESVQPGKTIAISISLSGCDVANGYTVELIYDKNIYELVGGTWQPQDLPFGTDSDSGTFLLEVPEVPNRSILTFTLRAMDEVASGTVTEISCKVTLLTEAGEIPVATAPRSIIIGCPHQFVKNVTAEYLKTPANCTDPAVYCKSCSLCGVADENQEFTSGKATGHNFKDREFTEYLAEAGDCQNRNIYYVSCAACGIRGQQTFEGRMLGEHVYDDDCDAKCNVCFGVRTVTHIPAKEFSSNVKGHWYACTRCEGKVDMTSHTPGPEATPEAPQTCVECGFVIAVHEEHVHAFGAEWVTDGESHWTECECGEKSEPEAHSWDTTDPALSVCQICGATKEVEVQPQPEPEQQTPQTPAPAQTQSKGPDMLVILLAILLVVSLIGNVVQMILLIKMRKQ